MTDEEKYAEQGTPVKIMNGTESIPRWFPGQSKRRPPEFKFKSPQGVFFRSQEEFYRMMQIAHS